MAYVSPKLITCCLERHPKWNKGDPVGFIYHWIACLGWLGGVPVGVTCEWGGGSEADHRQGGCLRPSPTQCNRCGFLLVIPPHLLGHLSFEFKELGRQVDCVVGINWD